MEKFHLKFIGLEGQELKEREEEVVASSLVEAISSLKSRYSIVQRVRYKGLYV